jgi:hypothetical protein
LASNSFTNLQSRLLLEVPHSTVQALVLSRQKEYREDLFGTDKKPGVIIPDRPSAIYALRSYLRLCMPITIEMEINNTVAAFERGGAGALVGTKTQFISAKTVGVAAITNPNAPTPSGPSAPPPTSDRVTETEKRVTDATVKRIQRALCVTPVNGKFDTGTRSAIQQFLALRGEPNTSAGLDRRTVGVLLDAADAIGSCRGQFLENVYEAINYGMPPNREQIVKSLQKKLADNLKDAAASLNLQQTGRFGDDSKFQNPTRSAIAELRKRLHANDAAAQNVKAPANRQMDAAFDSEITK